MSGSLSPLLAALFEACCGVALLYLATTSVTRGFDRFRAGQIVMVVGWAILGAPPLLMPHADAQAWNIAQLTGALGIAAGLAITWLGKRDRAGQRVNG